MVGLLREKGAGRVIVADMSGVQFVRFSKDRLDGSTRALMQRNARYIFWGLGLGAAFKFLTSWIKIFPASVSTSPSTGSACSRSATPAAPFTARKRSTS